MKLALNQESADALRELAEQIPVAARNIADDTVHLISVYQSVSEHLGPHRDSFYQMLLHVKKAQLLMSEALMVLPGMLERTAEKIEAYVAMNPQDSHASAASAAGASYSRGYGTGGRSLGMRHGGSADSGTPPFMSGLEMLDAFGIAQNRNGTDVFVKSFNYELFEEIYYNSERYPEHTYTTPVMAVISPELIEGIHLGQGEARNPAMFWQQHERGGTAESFQAIASHIPEVRSRLAEGATLSEIADDPALFMCVKLYFEKMPEVVKCGDFYMFQENGRHRIMAARALGYDIPVKIVGERHRVGKTDS